MTLSTKFSEEHKISIEPDHSAFLALSQAVKHSLNDRGVKASLSDVHESLSIGYGYKNYACYLEAMKAEAGRVVSCKELKSMEYFVVAQIGWINGEDVDHVDGMLLFPLDEAIDLAKAKGIHGSTLKDLISRHRGLDYLTEDEELMYEIDTQGIDFTRFVVNYTFNKAPSMERYGVPPYATFHSLREELLRDFHYRVCDELDCDVHDTGDCSGYTLFEVAVPADLAALIRERMVRRQG